MHHCIQLVVFKGVPGNESAGVAADALGEGLDAIPIPTRILGRLVDSRCAEVVLHPDLLADTVLFASLAERLHMGEDARHRLARHVLSAEVTADDIFLDVNVPYAADTVNLYITEREPVQTSAINVHTNPNRVRACLTVLEGADYMLSAKHQQRDGSFDNVVARAARGIEQEFAGKSGMHRFLIDTRGNVGLVRRSASADTIILAEQFGFDIINTD